MTITEFIVANWPFLAFLGGCAVIAIAYAGVKKGGRYRR